MPHVVLEGEPCLDEVENKLDPVFERDDNRVLKTESAWRGVVDESLLLEGRAIEDGPPRTFWVRIDRRDDGLVVRLHDFSDDVERTDGVKRVLGLVAQQLMQIDASLSVGKTNLEDYLD
jgi:CYTH domain-containing protein